jgi:site-specific DNA-methyltransferase (adenine-specific)
MKLIEGDCLEAMKDLADGSIDMVLTDPPYFKVKPDGWDHQWDTRTGFLDWLDACASEWARVLKPNGSVYCFASPQMAARVEVKLSERFNILNHIVWDKGRVSRMAKKDGGLRHFVPMSERLIFCENYNSDNIAKGEAGYIAKCDELRGFVFEPLRAYLDGERERAGFTVRQVAEHYQKKTGSRTVTGMAGHWFGAVQWALPTEANYLWLRGLFNGDHLRREYEDLRREYEDLRREYEDLRRFAFIPQSAQHTDIWTFKSTNTGASHPCEKPLDMIEHIITASTKPGAVVLDSFMGSGTTGVACANLGRDFVGIEKDPEYFQIAKGRIEEAQTKQQQAGLFGEVQP